MAKKKHKRLTKKQEKFCLEYFSDSRNQTECAVRAGFSAKTATITASRLLTNANIKKRIAELREKAEESAKMSRDEVIMELTKMARARLIDFLDDDGDINLKKLKRSYYILKGRGRNKNILIFKPCFFQVN